MKKQLRLNTMDRSSGFLRHRHRWAETPMQSVQCAECCVCICDVI